MTIVLTGLKAFGIASLSTKRPSLQQPPPVNNGPEYLPTGEFDNELSPPEPGRGRSSNLHYLTPPAVLDDDLDGFSFLVLAVAGPL